MKNSNKKAIAMALLISAVINPVGKEAFAEESTPTETIGNQNTSDQKNTDQPSNEPGTSGEDNVEPKVEDTNQPGVGGSETTQDDQNAENEDTTTNDNSTNDGGLNPYANLPAPTDDSTDDGSIPWREIQDIATPITNDDSEEDPVTPNVADRDYTFYYGANGSTVVESMEFEAYNPETGDVIKINKNSGKKVPKGYSLRGTIKMVPTYYNTNFGAQAISNEDFNIISSGEGDNGQITYKLDNFAPDFTGINDVRMQSILAGNNTTFNYASYYTEGGTWTDDIEPSERLRWNPDEGLYQIYIVPKESVYKPTDPVRYGYQFLGWDVKSYLNQTNKRNPKHYGPGEYNFTETDPLDRLNHASLANEVILKASWSQLEEIPYGFITEETNDLYIGEEQVIQPGKKGIQYKDANGNYVEKEKPIDEVKLVGTARRITELTPAEEPVEIDYITVHEETNDLYEGETQVIQEGIKGLGFYDSEGNVDQYINRPVNKVVLVGTAKRIAELTPAEELVDVDFITVEEPTDELLEGQRKVIQIGIKGKAFVNKNGNIVEYVDKPVNEVILVGTRKFTEMTPITPAEELVDVDFITIEELTDELLKGERKVIQVGIKGKAFVDAEGNIVEYVDRPVNEVILVGTRESKNPETPDNENPTNPDAPEKGDSEKPGKNQPETPEDPSKEEPIIPGTPDEDKPELPSTENTVTPDKSEESEDQDTSKKPEDTVKPGTPDKTENSDDIEESGEQETTDGKDDGDKVIVPTPDNKKPEGSEESGTTDKSETPDKSEESESQDTTDKKDDDGKIRVPSINKDNEPDDRNSSSKIKQSSESSIISADDNNTGTNVTRSPRSGHDNVQTGVSGAIGVASILATASLGLAATKNKEDEEE